MERRKKIPRARDDQCVWRVGDLNDARLLPITMCEGVRNELAHNVRLVVHEPHLSGTDPKGIRLTHSGQPPKDVFDEQDQRTAPRVLSPEQDGSLAAGTRCRRDNCPPVGNEPSESAFAAIQKDGRPTNAPAIEKLARSKELFTIRLGLPRELVLPRISQALSCSCERSR